MEDLFQLAHEAYQQNNYDLAQKYFHASLINAEKSEDFRAIALAQLGLAKSYYYLYEKQKCIHWFRAHLKTVEKYNFSDLEPMANYFMGVMFVETSDKDSSLFYSNRAIELMQKTKDWTGISKTHTILAELYLNEIPTDETQVYFHLNESEQFARKSGDLDALAFTMMKYFNFYFRNKKNYDRALYYINQTESLYHITQNAEAIYNTYRAKAECLIFLKDTSAHQYLHKWFAFKDSVLNEQKIQNVAKYETLFEVEKMELEMDLKNKQLIAEKKTKNMYLVVFILILIIVTFVYFTNRMRIKQQMQLVLAKQNEALVKEIYNAEQKERVRITRDLHDSIGQKLSVMKMLLPSDDNSELDKIRQYLNETAQEVRSISHNLIPEILNLGFPQALENLANHYNATKKIKFTLDFNDKESFQSFSKEVEVAVYRILQEMLSNIAKHAQSTEIKMTVFRDNDNLTLLIEENGRGIETEKITHSKGLGWKNIFARVQLLNGSIEIESKKGFGSSFTIKIPVHEA